MKSVELNKYSSKIMQDMPDKPLISFDYAIKYLLKDKSGYAIVEGFISALLASEGYKPIKQGTT